MKQVLAHNGNVNRVARMPTETAVQFTVGRDVLVPDLADIAECVIELKVVREIEQ